MTIALVIPVLNEEHVIAKTLAHSAWLGFDELIVADGGSTDRTMDLILEFQVQGSRFEVQPPDTLRTSHVELRPFSLPTPVTLMVAPPGRGRQMNMGARLSKSDVLVFLHADTLLPMDARRSIEQALRTSGCVGGRFDVRFDETTILGTLICHMMNLRSRLTGIATGDQAIFVRRTAFEALGGFADIPIMEDVEFSKRLKDQGTVEALRSRVTTSFRRWQFNGPIRTILLMWGLRLLYWLNVSPTRLKQWYSDAR